MVKRSCSLLKEKILNRKWSEREISFVKTISPSASFVFPHATDRGGVENN